MSGKERWQNRHLMYGAGSAISVLLVLGILTAIALLANWHPWRLDTTRRHTQSLSPVSKDLLKKVTQPLTMTIFLPEAARERPQAKATVELYHYHNPKVSYQFVDPERQPLRARQAGYRFPGNVLLTYQGRHQMAEQPDENAITNALRKVLQVQQKKVYFLTGHGERDLNDPKPGGFQVAKKALENEGYQVKTLNLLTQGLPKDATEIIVAGPKKPLMSTEVDILKSYLEKGGRLVVLLEAFDDAGLQGFLGSYGIGLDNGLILDVNRVSESLGLSAVMPLVSQYGPSKITRDFKNIVTIYPMARPLWLKKDVKGVSLLALATTMTTSYEKMGKEWIKANQAAFNAKTDKKGPFTVAAQAGIDLAPAKGEKPKAGAKGGEAAAPKEKQPKTYMVVFGDVEFAANGFFNLFGNGDLFLNTTNFLAQAMGQITVREAGKAQLLTLRTGQAWMLFVASLVWAPLVMLITGIWAYRRRRARR